MNPNWSMRYEFTAVWIRCGSVITCRRCHHQMIARWGQPDKCPICKLRKDGAR